MAFLSFLCHLVRNITEQMGNQNPHNLDGGGGGSAIIMLLQK
jgi:hypothetical protein